MWRVMIADDEPYIREGLEKLIDWSAIGCELVYSAENGQELLEEIQKCSPDVAVIDIKMPVMSGMEVAEFIYKNNIPTVVIFLTAYADFQYAQKAIQYKVSDYIIKTSALEEIPASIERIRKKKESEIVRSYRMIMITPVRQREKVRKFFIHAFHSIEYQILTLGDHEEGIMVTEKNGNQIEEIIQGCEKMRGFCENFLGEEPKIICSASYRKMEDTLLLYEQMQEYAKKKKHEEQIVLLEKEQILESEDVGNLLNRVQNYIQNHYAERITLEDIAEAVHVSSGYLSRFYKMKVGKNLFDTINSLRIEKAKALLEKGDKKIYEVASMTGFEDTAYFSKVFKKYAGCPPKEYEQTCGRR